MGADAEERLLRPTEADLDHLEQLLEWGGDEVTNEDLRGLIAEVRRLRRAA